MELTEKERLLLVEKKKQIQKLTAEILEIMEDQKQAKRIKKKITNILSILSVIGSYVKSKDYNLRLFSLMAEEIFEELNNQLLKEDLFVHFTVKKIEEFCIYVNSIQFDFTRKDLKIIFPKIDLSIFRAR